MVNLSFLNDPPLSRFVLMCIVRIECQKGLRAVFSAEKGRSPLSQARILSRGVFKSCQCPRSLRNGVV